MPELPVLLANFLEPRFARPARVTAIDELAPSLRRVQFCGHLLRDLSFHPGQEIEFRVAERSFRHYTPAQFDPDTGSLEVIFFLQGNGPGAQWVRSLAVDKNVNVLGPRGGLRLSNARHHIFLGDECTISLFHCLAQAHPGKVSGAIEVSPEGRHWLDLLDLPLDTVIRRDRRGNALIEFVSRLDIAPDQDVCFYLAGHTASIIRLRQDLLKLGWSRRKIRAKPHWADGRQGL